MKTYKETCEECMKEMFNRVGEEYPNQKLTKKKNWYLLRTWTKKEENDFREWMKKLLKKRYRWNKYLIEKEIGMFLLNWGWKTKNE